MATSQCEVIVWLDPPQTGDFPCNATVTFRACFRDPLLKTPIDPGAVIFKTGVAGALVTRAQTKDAVGFYHWLDDLITPGKWMLQAIAQDGSGNDEGIGTMQITVYDTGA
jgi:hypothetical protein